MLAEVITLSDTTPADIAAMLRKCAESIDAGAKPKSIIAVATEDDGSITIYGWGATDSMDCLATLQLAVLQHGQSMLAT